MKPENKPLTELLGEGWRMVTDLSRQMRVYGLEKQRIIYDCMNEQILWKYISEHKEEDTR